MVSDDRQMTLAVEPFTVDARELHANLGFTKDFSTWFWETARRINLKQGDDFSPRKGGSTGGRPRVEFGLTQRAAKRIQIHAVGEAGMAAREGAVKLHDHVEAVQAPTDDEIILRAQQILQSRVQALTERVAELEPRAEIADRLTAAEGDVSISEAARRIGIGARALFVLLRAEHVLFGSGDNARPYAEQIDAGRFRVRTLVVGCHPDGRDRIKGQTMATAKGLVWLAQRYGGK